MHDSFDRFRVEPPEIEPHLIKCREFAKDQRGFLILIGTVGSGKTYLSVAIARAVLGWKTVFISHSEFLRRHRLTYSSPKRRESEPEDEDILSVCQAASLLIFDDLGRRQAGRDEEALLFDLFNHRHENRRPTVITSNLSRAEFENFLGTALFDRLREACFALLEFNFPSKRPGLNDAYLKR